MIFKLENEELLAADVFIEEQTAKDDFLAVSGERWQYSFVQSGLGTAVSIKDLHLNESKDITCWDWWG